MKDRVILMGMNTIARSCQPNPSWQIWYHWL